MESHASNPVAYKNYSDGGGGDGISGRLAILEETVKEIKTEVRSNFRWLLGTVISSSLVLIASMLSILYVIDQRQESWIQHSINQIHSANQSQIDNNNSANRAFLDQMDRRISEQNRALERQLNHIMRRLD